MLIGNWCIVIKELLSERTIRIIELLTASKYNSQYGFSLLEFYNGHVGGCEFHRQVHFFFL